MFKAWMCRTIEIFSIWLEKTEHLNICDFAEFDSKYVKINLYLAFNVMLTVL